MMLLDAIRVPQMPGKHELLNLRVMELNFKEQNYLDTKEEKRFPKQRKWHEHRAKA